MTTTVKPIRMSEIKTEKRIKDTKANRQFYTLYFMDPNNPLAEMRQRNVFQSHVNDEGTACTWKSGDPTIMKQFIAEHREIPGEFLNVDVAPYKVGDRVVNSYSLILLKGEKLETILKQQGHVLATKVVAKAQEPVALN